MWFTYFSGLLSKSLMLGIIQNFLGGHNKFLGPERGA